MQSISHAISGVTTRQEMRVRKFTGTLIFVPEESLNLLWLDVEVVVVFIEYRDQNEYCVSEEYHCAYNSEDSTDHR